MSHPILSAKDLSKVLVNDDILQKRFRRTLWKVPELTVATPGFYVLAGRNGAGKSTLLRCLLGLLRPTTGTVSWFGQKRISAQDIGYLPEFPVIPPAAKVRNWLSWLLGIPPASLSRMDSELSRFPSLSVASLLEIPANRLSKGQTQRVQLWAALARSPKGVVVDEPFSGLDPWARVELADLLASILDEGRFVLMSTHELPERLRDKTRETWLIENETVQIHEGCVLPR